MIGSLLYLRVTDEDVEEVMAEYRMLPVSVWPPALQKQKMSQKSKRVCCCSKHRTSEENGREAEIVNMIPNKTHTPAPCEDATQRQTQCVEALEQSDEDQNTDHPSSDH